MKTDDFDSSTCGNQPATGMSFGPAAPAPEPGASRTGMPAAPRNARLRLRRPPALAFLAGLGLALGMASSAHAHNCATALQRFVNQFHCLEHAFKPVGTCVNNPSACAQEAATKLGSSMNGPIMVKAKEWQDVNGKYVKPMINLWTKVTQDKKDDLQEFFTGLKDRDLPRAQRKLLLVLQYIKDTYGPEFRSALLELQKIDSAKRGSLTLSFSAGGGFIGEGTIGVGAAIDLDYLLTLTLTAGSSTEAFRDQQAVDPITSYFVMGGGSLGGQAGASASLLVGYSVGEAKDAVGPSMAAGVEGTIGPIGAAAEISFDVGGPDPVFDGVGIGPAVGIHVAAGSVGVLYTDIFGVSCMNWEFMRGAFLPERFLVEQGLISQKTSNSCPPAVPGEKIFLRSNANKCFAKKEPGNTNNGNPVHLWDNYGCDIWYYESKTGLIRVGANTNQCLHKKDSDTDWANGKITHLWTCDAANKNAQWNYDHGTGLIRSRAHSSKCLHKKDPGSNNGNVIHVWDCGDPRENNQWWVKTVWY